MKKIAILLIAISIALAGCKKANPCANTTCINGGTCDETTGACVCPSGYTGVHCEIAPVVDPCAGVVCQNGGTCNNGNCQCPPGYDGLNCQTQLTPTSVTIDTFILENWPQTNNGTPWNATGGPNIYLQLINNTTHAAVMTSGVNNNCQPTYYYLYVGSVVITDLNSTYTLQLWNQGSNNNTLMCTASYTIYFAPLGFPRYSTLSNSCLSVYQNYLYQF